jgi:beta-glucosidase
MVEVRATQPAYPQLTRNSLLKEFKRHPKGKAVYPQLVEAPDMGIPDEQVEADSDLTPDETAASLQGVSVFCR